MATSAEPAPRRIEIAPRTIFTLFGIVAGIWILGQLRTVMTVLIIALVMVGTFDPVVAWLEQRGLRRGRALILVFAVAGLSLIGVIVLMVPPLVAQLLALIEEAPRQRANLVHTLQGYSWSKPFVKTLIDLPVDDLGKRAAGAMIGYSTDMLEMVGFGISTLFLSIYLLADPVRSKGLLYAVIPRHYHVKLAKVLLELKVIVGGYMRGQLITSLAIAVFVFVLLTVSGAENALALALFAGLTDIIPFVGGYVASAPVIIAVVPSGTTVIVIVTVLMVLYQEFESRILVPRVYGRTLRLPPAIVLVALLVGGTLAGIVGALLALPIAAGLQLVMRELRVDLPGESVEHDRVKALDLQAVRVYEELTENISAADAGVIADDLASLVKRSEEGGPTLSAQLPVVTPPTV
ncbi:MAG TPA: AI-2E family transporter [Kofleriaceae bacterium]|nr:AI-2E family transporter [Kofleriaceae bacterium]